MLFNSFEFLIFLPVVLALYYLSTLRWQNRMLLAASLLFYGWWDYRFLSLLLFSATLDFCFGLALDRPGQSARYRKSLIVLSLVSNLGLLGFFKYYNFFVDSAVALLVQLGIQTGTRSLDIILPVGISFYTFQSLSYTIDVYRGELKATRSWFDFLLFVSFFPQLVAGPIERATHLLPQMTKKRTLCWEDIQAGVLLILTGLFKKMFIADGLAAWVSPCFSDPQTKSSMDLLLGVYFFAFQIYCDFSGYSDIAIGSARLMGVRLMENFLQPYFSTSITEFWRRWHVSLSTWLRDYLYIPLGGNRGSKLRTELNLFATMLLGGLWHGASWLFVLWGFLHGLYLSMHKVLLRGIKVKAEVGLRKHSLPVFILKAFVTFNLVCLTWIFFRAKTMSQAQAVLTGIVKWHGGFHVQPKMLCAIVLLFIVVVDLPQYWSRQHCVVLRWPFWLRHAYYALMVWGVLFAACTIQKAEFIYFQF